LIFQGVLVLETFLYIVFFVSCVLLIGSVLLQPGKTDAGALFTSNISSAALNPRGTQSVLSKMTIAMAAVFMMSALLLALPAVTGKVSVLETQGETKPATTDAGAANANTAAPANSSNSASNTGSAKPAEPKKEESAKPAEEKKDPASKEDRGEESK